MFTIYKLVHLVRTTYVYNLYKGLQSDDDAIFFLYELKAPLSGREGIHIFIYTQYYSCLLVLSIAILLRSCQNALTRDRILDNFCIYEFPAPIFTGAPKTFSTNKKHVVIICHLRVYTVILRSRQLDQVVTAQRFADPVAYVIFFMNWDIVHIYYIRQFQPIHGYYYFVLICYSIFAQGNTLDHRIFYYFLVFLYF